MWARKGSPAARALLARAHGSARRRRDVPVARRRADGRRPRRGGLERRWRASGRTGRSCSGRDARRGSTRSAGCSRSTTTTPSSCGGSAPTRCSAGRRGCCAGCACRVPARVAQALLRALCGQLITSRRRGALERRSSARDGAARTAAARAADRGRARAALARRAAAARPARPPRRDARPGLPLARPRAAARAADRRGRRRGSSRERGLGPWSVGRRLPRGPRPLRARPRRRPRADQARSRAARPPGRGRGDRRAARAVRRVGRPRERLPAAASRAGSSRRGPPARTLAAARLRRMAVDPRRIAILGAGKIGEALLAGLLSSGWREPSELVASRAARRAGRRARASATASWRRSRTPRRSAGAGARRRSPSSRRTSTSCSARSAGCSRPSRRSSRSRRRSRPRAIERRLADGVPVVRAMPNTPAIVHEGIAGICAGAHASDEHLALAEEVLAHLGARRAGRRAVHGRGHGRLRLGPGLLRAARRGDDRGRASCSASRARSRRSSSSRRCSARRSSCATRRCTRSSCARWSPRRAERRSARSASSSAPACAPRSSTRSRPRWTGRASSPAGAVTASSCRVVDEPRRRRARRRRSSSGRRAPAAHVALAGGSTPRRAYELAAALEPDWSRATLWWGDDRCVPPDDERSNYRLAREALLDRVERPPDRPPHPRRARRGRRPRPRTTRELAGVALDLVLLGIGPDGHTASLFPDAPALDERERLAVAAEAGLEPWVDARDDDHPRAFGAARSCSSSSSARTKAEAAARAFARPARPRDAGEPRPLAAGDDGRDPRPRAAAARPGHSRPI